MVGAPPSVLRVWVDVTVCLCVLEGSGGSPSCSLKQKYCSLCGLSEGTLIESPSVFRARLCVFAVAVAAQEDRRTRHINQPNGVSGLQVIVPLPSILSRES